MAESSASGARKTQAELRAERLKKALKSNMARRKAQAKAREASKSDKDEGATDPGEDGS